jgi:hypothetical protein
MPEHRIRLRGGWECHYREGDDPEGKEICRRVDLPLAPPIEFAARFQLCRQFGRPPSDPRIESVMLELRQVSGLKAARLNGLPITPVDSSDLDWLIELREPLLPRNGLILEVELDASSPPAGTAWGEVALLIRPKGTSVVEE